MNTDTAKNQIKQIFSDSEQEENQEKRSVLYKRYLTLRQFCLECEIFTFTELERFEYECKERLNKLNKKSI